MIEVDTPENLREKLYGRKVVFHLRELDPVWLEGVKSLSGVKDVQSIEQKLLVGMDDLKVSIPGLSAGSWQPAQTSCL